MATSKLLFKDPKKKILNENLLSETAELFVKNFSKSDIDQRKNKPLNNAPTSTQIRKFYNDVLTLKAKIENDEEKFNELLPYIKMLKAKVAYAKSRKNVNSKFKSFINGYVDTIKDLDDFNAFCDLFEAIVAYSTVYLKK